MGDHFRFLLNRLGERLWVRPLVMCALSIVGVFLTKTADMIDSSLPIPEIAAGSIKTLLSIISSSMLVIATFAVASMVSAYASAGNTATPRSFPLIIADDVSQNALSAFIGAFIFSIVALIAVENSYYEKTGRFALFALTLVVFAIVIVTFVRWVDRIARLIAAVQQRRRSPHLGGLPAGPGPYTGRAIHAASIGYVQRVDIGALQRCAEAADLHIVVNALPGSFATPNRPVAWVAAEPGTSSAIDTTKIAGAFLIGQDRTFDEDPRFGLIVLAEIAGRALSPAVNDPGTAIDIVGTLTRIFAEWLAPDDAAGTTAAPCGRVIVPAIDPADMFDDAFTTIARDGAGAVEVVIWLLKTLETLASIGDVGTRDIARQHARLALARAESALTCSADLERARAAAAFASAG
jgi:uncharacterized membrane protein